MNVADCPNLAVPLTVMQHVMRVESGFNPYAIGVVGGRLVRQPRNLPEAVATAGMLEKNGFNFSVGLAQVNRYNLSRYGMPSYEKAFDACDNIRVGSQILRACYQRAGDWGKALSCYYSGNFETGQRPESAFGNTSYVQRIGYVVPSTRAEQQTASPSSGEAPAVPSDNTVYPDSVIRGVIPAPDTTPTSIAAYPPHVVRGGLAVSSD